MSDAAWVTERPKPVSNRRFLKQLTPYKLALLSFSAVVRDAAALYDALVARPLALANKFDNTVIGGTTKPGDTFEDMTACTSYR